MFRVNDDDPGLEEYLHSDGKLLISRDQFLAFIVIVVVMMIMSVETSIFVGAGIILESKSLKGRLEAIGLKIRMSEGTRTLVKDIHEEEWMNGSRLSELKRNEITIIAWWLEIREEDLGESLACFF